MKKFLIPFVLVLALFWDSAQAYTTSILMDSGSVPYSLDVSMSDGPLPPGEMVCLLTGQVAGDPAGTAPSWSMAPFTGTNATPAQSRVLFPNYYGSTGCSRDSQGHWGMFSNSCSSSSCSAQPQGIRTVQGFYSVPVVLTPWVSGGVLRLQTYLTRTPPNVGGSAAQTIFMYVGVVDTTSMRSMWFTISLWDSRGVAVAPGVISDAQNGGGTANFNILTRLDDTYQRYVTRHPQSQGSVTAYPGAIQSWYSGSISRDQLLNAINDANALIQSDPVSFGTPLFSTDVNVYRVTAMAVDGESARVATTDPQDSFGFSFWGVMLVREATDAPPVKRVKKKVVRNG